MEREGIIRAITPLTHLSDTSLHQLLLLCAYTLKITVILLNIFCNVWVVFFVTHILYDSPEFAFALSARRYFAFSSGEINSQCHILYLSNIGLFHVIYKTVNDFILCKANQVT